MKYLLVCLLCIHFSIAAQSTVSNIPDKESQGIDTTEIVSIGDSKQYIRLKGDAIEHPLLLFLNGGPGDSVLGAMDKMFGALQKEFIVVLWDQRKTGKTKELNNPQGQLTQAVFENDTKTLVQYLLKRFERKKIVLVGHSYGTSLGFYMADNHPEVLHAYIAVNPMVKQVESEQITLRMLKEHAGKTSNARATKELAEVVVPFETAEQLYFARKWLFDFEGKSFAKKKGFKKRVLSWSSSWLKLFNEASRVNLFEKTATYGCPVYFMLGQKDYQTNFTLSKTYFQKIEAPKKALFVVENAGHLIPFEQSSTFQENIIVRILPEMIQVED